MALQEQTSDVSYVINDLNSRIRLLESKYNLFGERLLVINKNMIEEYKKILEKQRLLQAEMKEIKNAVEMLKEIIKKTEKNFSGFAKREDLKVLEKYVELWNPVKFITEEDVISIIKRHKNG